jgi:hypothetical protein
MSTQTGPAVTGRILANVATPELQGVAVGRRGPKPEYAKREAFAKLLAEGVPSERASRMVGINPRTGKRWRNGRKVKSGRSVLNQCTQFRVSTSTWSTSRQGPCRRINSFLDDPTVVSARALSNVSPMDRTEGSTTSSMSRWVNAIEVNCEPASMWR